LAFAEAERYLPSLITKIESILDQHGLYKEEIVIRMTGCPNGCGRPYLAEIGFVGNRKDTITSIWAEILTEPASMRSIKKRLPKMKFWPNCRP